MDALEFGRIIHAEMAAITDAARLGRATSGAILYSTTFPCHMCAKHIVAAGISTVVFLEPYPKSLASDLHSDSFEIDGQSRGVYSHFKATKFNHFAGVSPRRYRDLFEKKKRKDKNGAFSDWMSTPRRPNISLSIPLYLTMELQIIKNVLSTYLEKIGAKVDILNFEGEELRKEIALTAQE